MPTLKILETKGSSFPAQELKVSRSGTAGIIGHRGNPKYYNLNVAIAEMNVVSETETDAIFDIQLRDKTSFRGRAPKGWVYDRLRYQHGHGVLPESYKFEPKPKDGGDSHPKSTLWLVIGCIVVFALLGNSLVSQNNSTQPANTVTTLPSTPTDPLNNMKGYEVFLAAEEEYFKTHRGADADLYKIHTMVNLFSSMAEEISRAHEKKAELSAADLAYVKKIEQRLSGLQQRTLPALRLAFRKQASAILWEQDISVSVSGGGNSTIIFVGHLFAANANIKEVQDQLQDDLAQLRFKRTRYQWYKGSEGWSYQLESPPDSAIRMYKFHQFTEPAK